jgi:hypothetical protein
MQFREALEIVGGVLSGYVLATEVKKLQIQKMLGGLCKNVHTE